MTTISLRLTEGFRQDLKHGTTLLDETIATGVGQYALFEMR